MYWFLVMRSDIGAQRGNVECVKGRTIGAAPWVDLGLRRLFDSEAVSTLIRDRSADHSRAGRTLMGAGSSISE